MPGSADRIIVLWEEQSKHRRGLEKVAIEASIKDAQKGLWFGFIIGMTTIIGSIACILKGQTTSGSILGTAGLTGLVGVFVYGSRQRKQERELKYKIGLQQNDNLSP